MDYFTNITFRRGTRTKSETNNESCDGKELSSQTIDGSTCSLPDLSADGSTCLNVESEIKELKLQVAIAHNEVKELSLQNSSLANELDALRKKYELVKKLTKYSTPKKHKQKTSTPSKSSNINPKNANTSVERMPTNLVKDSKNHTPTTPIPCTSKCVAPETKTSPYAHNTMTMTLPKILQEKRIKTTQSEAISSNKPYKIHILGDESVRGLASLMLKARQYKWNDLYQISSTVMPFANTKQIIGSSKTTLSSLSTQDIIILSTGNHDVNKHVFLTELQETLIRFKNNDIFLLCVDDNQSKMSHTLNKILYSLEKQFVNCTVINTNDLKTMYKLPTLLDKICFKLNIEIDAQKYQTEFVKKLPQHIQRINKEQKRYAKGTIPYFFNLQNSKNKVLQVLNKEQKYAKGTIPYLFSLQHTKNKQVISTECNKNSKFFRV